MGLYKKTCSGDTQNKKNEYLRRKFFCIDPFFLFWRHLTASKVSGEKIFCYRPTHQKTSIFQIYLMYGSDYYLEVLEPQNSRNGQNAFRKLFVGECWYSLKKWSGNREERTRCSRKPIRAMDGACRQPVPLPYTISTSLGNSHSETLQLPEGILFVPGVRPVSQWSLTNFQVTSCSYKTSQVSPSVRTYSPS